MCDDNVVKGLVGPAEAGETDFDDHFFFLLYAALKPRAERDLAQTVMQIGSAVVGRFGRIILLKVLAMWYEQVLPNRIESLGDPAGLVHSSQSNQVGGA